MAAYASHLRKVHNTEVLYGGSKPQAKPFTTDRDILDRHHRFLRDDDAADPEDPLLKEYYESLIKDCVLVDLSRYKEKQVAMRWRTMDEVKVGKGEKICANVSCGKDEGLEGMEVAFGYVEDGKHKNVMVKCVLCEKCGRKMRKAHGNDKSKKRSRSHSRDQKNLDDDRRRHDHGGHHGRKRHKHEKTSKELKHNGASDSENFLKALESELATKSP